MRELTPESSGPSRELACGPIELKRALGLFSCTMLVVGNMIGVGIFTTPGRIAIQLPSSGLVLLAWILGAFLAMAGALSYAELGAAWPAAGGNYVFLREAYGPLWGFLYGWAGALITQSGTVAILAVGFTKYAGITTPLHVQACAVGLVLFFGLLNYIGVQVGAGVVDVITFLKILAILVFAVAGVFFGQGHLANVAPIWPATGGVWIAGGFATALIPIMYTYSGWNATVYVGSEVKSPGRTIPLSLIAGVSITAALYLILNGVYMLAVPVPAMKGVIAIARTVSESMFGSSAARLLSGFIAFSVLGCLNATLLTAPRISFAMAQDGYFFKRFANVHPRFRTPSAAIALVTLWGALLAVWGGIDHTNFYRLLDDYVTVPSLLINALTVMALFHLRRTQPERPRPYRAWGYPVLPAAFIVVVFWMVFNEFRQDPHAALAGIAMFAAGIPFYLYFRREKMSHEESPYEMEYKNGHGVGGWGPQGLFSRRPKQPKDPFNESPLISSGAAIARFDFDRTLIGAELPHFDRLVLNGHGSDLWAIQVDPQHPSGPHVLAYGHAKEDSPDTPEDLSFDDGKSSGNHRAWAAAFAKDIVLEAGDMTVAFKPASGPDARGGFFYRYQDPSTFYLMEWDAVGEFLRCTAFKGKWKEVNRISGVVTPDVWHTVRLIFQKDTYEVFMDNELAIGGRDKAILGAGRVGLAVAAEDSAAFNHWIIRSPRRRSTSFHPASLKV